jgi:hypothetical protein
LCFGSGCSFPSSDFSPFFCFAVADGYAADEMSVGARYDNILTLHWRTLRMNTIYFAAFVAAELILARAPGTPVALVEAVNGNSADVEFMDYVDPGKVIHLNSHDWIVLSYLKSCVRETITGGIVTVGTERSEVESGKVERSVVPCEAGKMLLTTQTASQAAGMVFRSGSGPRPQFTLYGLSPIVELKGGGTLLLERIDRPGERYTVAVDERQLLHGAFYDFANSDRKLAAGGVYKAVFGAQQVVFKVDPQSKPGQAPIVGRLLRLGPAN